MRVAALSLLVLLSACGEKQPADNETDRIVAPSPSVSPSPVIAVRHVLDDAEVLSPSARTAMEARLSDVERRTQRRILVVTVASLQGRSTEEASEAIGARAGITNGALLLFAPKERELRLSAAGSSGALLSDARARQIVEQVMRPDLKADRFEAGIVKGIDHVAAVLSETMG
ncbi:hypothetical protein DMC47_28595 [Nostoc sp. 3335mG]|nr:hypothetical protein DMC47_28595 [Nostoc sp. 3335mG]